MRDAGGWNRGSGVINWQGLRDSIAGVVEAPPKCRDCGATTRLGNGLCLNCTLHEGLDRNHEASRESFEAILSEDDVKDTHWRVGNYEVLEEIGRGGMGVIYRARQRHSRRIVALKRMVSYHADSEETLKRFRREAEAAVRQALEQEVVALKQAQEAEQRARQEAEKARKAADKQPW